MGTAMQQLREIGPESHARAARERREGPSSALSEATQVSIVIPMYNAETTIRHAITSLLEQEGARVTEIIVVDDESEDRSVEVVQALAKTNPEIRLIRQEHRGAPRTVNHGIQEARGSIVGLLDSDAAVDSRWLVNLLQPFGDPEVYAAAGRIEIANPHSFWARIAGSELIHRYARIRDSKVDHLSTCNILYRREVFDAPGFFNPRFQIGYDVDMSYRIAALGKRVFFCRDAICTNFWRESGSSYYRQQFRYAYDRAELISAHPGRLTGDDVTGLRMLLQVPITALLLASAAFAAYALALTGSWTWFLLPIILLLALVVERFHEAISAFLVTGDRVALWLPPLHIARNVAWVAGVAYWFANRLRFKRRARPARS